MRGGSALLVIASLFLSGGSAAFAVFKFALDFPFGTHHDTFASDVVVMGVLTTSLVCLFALAGLVRIRRGAATIGFTLQSVVTVLTLVVAGLFESVFFALRRHDENPPLLVVAVAISLVLAAVPPLAAALGWNAMRRPNGVARPKWLSAVRGALPVFIAMAAAAIAYVVPVVLGTVVVG